LSWKLKHGRDYFTEKYSMIHLLGIRHHGPGSARSVMAALANIQPDCVLIEGPSDADALIEHVLDPAFVTPVALLVNTPIQKQERPKAVFYPFADFSPEWQAMRFAVQQQIHVRFMDLACQHGFAIEAEWQEKVAAQAQLAETDESSESANPTDEPAPSDDQALNVDDVLLDRIDPIHLLAQSAGYQDSERFWEHLVEQQPHAGDVFELIGDAMQAVREHVESQYSDAQKASYSYYREQLREASMRKTMRQAEKDGYQNIVVVCGAWHVPALRELKKTQKDDNALLKGIAKVKTESAWIAWTHGRLNRDSGYGAGIESVGWYAHLWKHYQLTTQGEAVDAEKISIDWLSRFAHALRQNGQDASSAQLIDATQLIQALLHLRGRHLPDLDDLQEAIVSVLHHGYDLPQPVLDQLLADEKLGQVPESLQTLPIQQDFMQQCKSFRLKLEAPHKSIELDLRTPFDLAKSQFLHRLKLLGLNWAKLESYQKGRGSYKESWTLSWQPENSLYLNEMSVWGNRIDNAAQAYINDQIQHTDQIAQIAEAIEQLLLAALDDSLDAALFKLDELSSQQHDPILLIDALAPLANAARYGSVRPFDPELLQQIIQRFALRISLSLPMHCQNLNDDVAHERVKQLEKFYQLIDVLDDQDLKQAWQTLLLKLLNTETLHGYLQGWCCRLAREQQLIEEDDAKTRFSKALSVGQNPDYSAAWFEGFMTHQALLLIHDDTLWQLVDQWLLDLPEQQFIELLPLLRRTTSSFTSPERQQLAQKSNHGQTTITQRGADQINTARAQQVIQVLQQWLALPLDKDLNNSNLTQQPATEQPA
jgi:hypothetical protein